MSRKPRPYLPGGTFHVTARIQGREALFAPELRGAFVAILRQHIAFSDAEVFAYVVMPNHFHLVIRQGMAPLSRLMQPLLHRTARLIHRSYQREGHVFERRYRSHLCGTSRYFRNAIIYTHLNPVRAGLCDTPTEYPWSSHNAWLGHEVAADGRPYPVSLDRATQVFASGPERTAAELSLDYLAFLEWREQCDRLRGGGHAAEGTAPPEPPGSPVDHGDLNWMHYVMPPEEARPAASPNGSPDRRQRPDLTTICAAVIRGEGPDLLPEIVRSRWGGPIYVRARHAVIRQAAAAGYRAGEIAAYLRLSTTAVFDVLTAERKRLLEPWS